MELPVKAKEDICDDINYIEHLLDFENNRIFHLHLMKRNCKLQYYEQTRLSPNSNITDLLKR